MLATVSDKKLQHSTDNITVDYSTADVVSAHDYYPFGMLMPGRKYSVANTNYRYRFNGKELDKEDPVQYDYGDRIYDPRLALFKSIDPLQKKHQNESPYIFVGGNPIAFADPDGRDRIIKTTTIYELGNGNSISLTSTKF